GYCIIRYYKGGFYMHLEEEMEFLANNMLPITIILVFIVLSVISYIYTGIVLMVIARKTGTAGGWMAWVPVASIVLMCNIALKPLWLVIPCLIPAVSIIPFIMLWKAMAERRNKPGWVAFLLLVPVVQIFIPAYIAFFD
ncbi:MAG: hypothetical protein ABRQ37_21480, partial [Candidatus Eremiobacterota bacterium]